MGSAEIGARGFPLIGRFPRGMLSAQWTVAGACIKKCATVISGLSAHATECATGGGHRTSHRRRYGAAPVNTAWMARTAGPSEPRCANARGPLPARLLHWGAPCTTTILPQPPAALRAPEIGPHRLPQVLPCHSHLHSIPGCWTRCAATTEAAGGPRWA